MNWVNATLYSPAGTGKYVVIYCENLLLFEIIKSEDYNTFNKKDANGIEAVITKWFYLEV